MRRTKKELYAACDDYTAGEIQDLLRRKPKPKKEPQMQTYKCHKEVQAAKILVIAEEVGGEHYLLNLDGCAPQMVKAEWVSKHAPEKGGYLVKYADGYLSYSPAKAFDEGYSLVG